MNPIDDHQGLDSVNEGRLLSVQNWNSGTEKVIFRDN